MYVHIFVSPHIFNSLQLYSISSFLFSSSLLSFFYFIPLAPDDYTFVSPSFLTFPSGSSEAATQCVNISIADDNNFEQDVEIFSINLTKTVSFMNVVLDSGKVEIRDNESKR